MLYVYHVLCTKARHSQLQHSHTSIKNHHEKNFKLQALVFTYPLVLPYFKPVFPDDKEDLDNKQIKWSLFELFKQVTYHDFYN